MRRYQQDDLSEAILVRRYQQDDLNKAICHNGDRPVLSELSCKTTDLKLAITSVHPGICTFNFICLAFKSESSPRQLHAARPLLFKLRRVQQTVKEIAVVRIYGEVLEICPAIFD